MAKTSKITISKSGDPSNIGTKSNTSLTPTNTPTSDTSNEKVLQQLQDINQNTMDSADAIAKTNASINNLTEAINNLKTATASSSSSQKNTTDDPVFTERLQKLKNDNALMVQKAEEEKKKAADEASIRQVRLQQAQFNFARSQELAAQQNEDRARRLAENAEAQLKREREEVGKYGPLAAVGRGVSAVTGAQPGFASKSITAALTGGLGNLVGLDKVVSAAGSGLGKLATGIVGKPFQAMAKKREQNKADKQAIDNAVHAAELNKRIQDVLKAKGLAGDGESKDAKKKDSSGATKGATATTPLKGTEDRLDKIDNTLKGMTRSEEKKEEKEEDSFFSKLLSMAGSLIGKIGGFLSNNLGTILLAGLATYVGLKLKDLWAGFNSGMITYWGKAKNIWNSIKSSNSKALQMLKSGASSVWNGLKSLGSKVGTAVKSGLSKIAPKISNAMSAIANTAKGAFNSLKTGISKVVNPLKTLGGKVTGAISKLGNTGIGKVVSKVGGAAAKGAKLFGKVLGPVMSLIETGSVLKDAATKGTAQTIEDYKKNWKWYDYLNPSKMAAVGGGWVGDKVGDLMSWWKHGGKTPQQEVAELRAKQNGTTVEEELKALQSPAQKAADKQSFTVKEKENSVVYGDVAKQEEQAAADKARYEKLADKYTHAAQVNKEAGKVSAAAVRSNLAKEYGQKAKEMDELNGTMRTWSENDDMYAVEINKDLLTNSGQLSEEGILILKRQGVTDQQMQQIQNVMNSSVNNSGSNIYQTNVTQYSDKPVYATGDAARTMDM